VYDGSQDLRFCRRIGLIFDCAGGRCRFRRPVWSFRLCRLHV